MPRLLLTFMHATTDETASTEDLALLVKREPGLAARILTVANSAAFRSGGGLRSVQQSLQVLGTRLLRSIAACLAVQGAFARMPLAQPDDLAGFWRHSLFVAELARAIAAEVGHADGEEAYLAGLLHDVGELLLLGGLGTRYGTLLAQAGEEGDLPALERAALTTDHAAVGGWLVDAWQLPSFMADAIVFHHHPADEVRGADTLTRIVWAAHAAGELLAHDPPDMAAYEAVGAVLGVDALLIARLCGEAAANMATLAAALGMAAVPPTQTMPLWRGGSDVAQADELQTAVLAMAVAQPLQQDLAGVLDEAELLMAARESARILFGAGEVAFFLRRQAQGPLLAVPLAGQPAHWSAWQLAPDAAHGVCAEAAASGQVRSTFDPGHPPRLALADAQLARGLASEGLMCVPMHAGGTLAGVMVYGISKTQHARLQGHAVLLRPLADITARTLHAWQALRERERQLAADCNDHHRLRARQVAHEAGNPLGIIKNYLLVIDSKLPQAGALNEELGILREEVDRVANIVRQLQHDTAPPAAAAGLVDLKGIIEGMRSLYGESLFGAAGVRLELELPAPLAPTRADRDTVKQIVLNLWKNAAEAAPAGSRVLTTCADHVHHDGKVYTEISVSDAGPGLPADALARLFQPLGAARRPGHAGLGLSIVNALVQRLGGQISCHTRPHSGTVFVVRLPQATQVAS